MLPAKFMLIVVAFGVQYVSGDDDIDYTVLRGQAISKLAETMFNPKREPIPTRKCDMLCTAEIDYVCAFNWCEGFMTFGNPCELKVHNSCESPYYIYLCHGKCEDIFNYICVHDTADVDKKRKKKK